MRLSGTWRILQIKEGIIHRGRKPRWITPLEICRILHILWKLNSIIALLFIQNISPFLKEFCHFALCFSAHQNNTTLCQVFSANSSIICSGLQFWRHCDIISSIIFSGLHFSHFKGFLRALASEVKSYLVQKDENCSYPCLGSNALWWKTTEETICLASEVYPLSKLTRPVCSWFHQRCQTAYDTERNDHCR